VFPAPASSDVFQEVEGESEERRRARLERHQRTRERAAKALAEKNERDMQVQREQAERDVCANAFRIWISLIMLILVQGNTQQSTLCIIVSLFHNLIIILLSH